MKKLISLVISICAVLTVVSATTDVVEKVVVDSNQDVANGEVTPNGPGEWW